MYVLLLLATLISAVLRLGLIFLYLRWIDMAYITPQDIAERIRRVNPIWFNGPPVVTLEGQPGAFGKLRFDFRDGCVPLEYGVYIRDREVVLRAANEAITNFATLCKHIAD